MRAVTVMRHSESTRVMRLLCALLVGLTLASVAPAAELVLSEFNGTGVSYSFGSLSHTVGPTSLRLSGSTDSGGFGVVTPLDLTPFADGRFVIDFEKNVGNTVNAFDMELIDSSGNAGKYRIGLSEFSTGVPSQAISSTTLSNPTHGNGFNSLDLGSIATWQVVGTYSTPSPFDISFDRILVSDTVAAPPAYPGAEPDALWRTEAATRIANHRMADLQVHVRDAAGISVPNAEIAVRMKRHEFGFGTAVRSKNLIDPGANNDIYRDTLKQLFNTSVLENALKWKPWAGEFGPNWSQARTRQAVDWLNAENIELRGHNLVWPGYSNLPNVVQTRLEDFVNNGTPLTSAQQAQVRALVELHIADIAGEFEGDIAAWDVVNEPRSNRDIMDALPEGESVMVDWFNAARNADINAKLYLNDFDIIAGGGVDTFNQQDYFDRAEFLVNAGAPIDGLGFQSHFVEGALTGPEQVWEILDRFDTLGLEMQITEFDFETMNEQLQADYTRDFMTAAFAHEGIDDFLTWGFWEGEHWRPDAAMYRQDWSIKPNGQAYIDLVFDEWWTDEDLVSTAVGLAETRGFKGEYEITVTYNGEQVTVPAVLSDDGLTLDIVLNQLAADFNGDGVVDAADYTTWRDGLGTDYTVADYDLWVASFGAQLGASSQAVPEPTSVVLLASLACLRLRGMRVGRCVPRTLFDRRSTAE